MEGAERSDCRSKMKTRVAALARQAALDMGPSSVVIDGHDVTNAIRTPEIDRAAAATARLPKVRAALVERQRKGRRARGHRHGRTRHWHGGFSECRREDLSRRVARRARAPASGGSVARHQPRGGGRGCGDGDGRTGSVRQNALDVAAHDSEGRDRARYDRLSIDETVDRVLAIVNRCDHRPTVIAGSGVPSHLKR